MLASKLGSKWVGMALLTLLMLSLAPISIGYAQNQEGKKAEKFVELASRAGHKVGNFIDLIYANETARENITYAGLMDALDANKTLFETWGLGNLTEAETALQAEDYEGAIANATEALSIFREVFKALNAIMEESGVQRGQLIDAQGLIQAMKRALDRIQRLREIVPEESDEIPEILDSAEACLNITKALDWLSQGKVNETAHNITQANKLISLAHRSLKKKAQELNPKRIWGFLIGINKSIERTEEMLERASGREINVTAVLELLGYTDEDGDGNLDMKDFVLSFKGLIESAKGKGQGQRIKGAIEDLKTIREKLRDVHRELARERKGGARGRRED